MVMGLSLIHHLARLRLLMEEILLTTYYLSNHLTKTPNRYIGVSKNRGTPKSSILIGFSIINHPFWGTIIFGNTYIKIHIITPLSSFTSQGASGPSGPSSHSDAPGGDATPGNGARNVANGADVANGDVVVTEDGNAAAMGAPRLSHVEVPPAVTC